MGLTWISRAARVAAVACAALFAGACTEPPLPLDPAKLVAAPEGATAAIDHAMAAFAIPASHRPTVYWQGPAGLDCFGGRGFVVDGDCLTGVEGAEGILLALPDPNMRPHETCIVHELGHWKWNDHDHASLATWGPDPSCGDGVVQSGSVVGDEVAALVAIGL